MDIASVVAALQARYGARLLSGIGPVPSDIDLALPPEQRAAARAFVLDEGFVLTHERPEQIDARRFEGGNLYILDLLTDFSLYAEATPFLRLTRTGHEVLEASPPLHACYKALCLGQKAKLPLLEAQDVAFRRFLAVPAHFRDGAPFSAVEAARSWEALFQTVSQRSWVQRFGYRLRCYRAGLGRGVSMAFIGPDGSGKSFFIEKMRGVGSSAVVYMGDWYFLLQPLYNVILERVPSPWNRFLYLFYFIENLARQAKVSALRRIGRIVLLDRFPGTNRNLRNAGLLHALNRATFRCFPKPDLIVLLMAPPEIVHARKQELSVEDIRLLQVRLKAFLTGAPHVALDTERLDESLNFLLAFAAQRRLRVLLPRSPL